MPLETSNRDIRLLLVDDEKAILRSFSLMLSDFGFPLTTASNAAEALDLIRNRQFDIVFLDQHIGRDRGLDLMQEMVQIDRTLYYVIITADGNAGLAVEALKRGASDFLTKPLFAANIIKSIDFVRRKRELDLQTRDMFLTLETKVMERTQELESIHIALLSSLAQALEARDFSTCGHCKRVSHYSRQIADELGLGAEEKKCLEIGALLHDVGKIGISDSILFKPEKLDGTEWQSLKNHPQKGVEILRPLKYLEPALPAILHHHENFDGTGYPDRLRGADIPLNARIISVADAWDVMRSDRPYRKMLSREAAIEELSNYAGRQFDPEIVKIFIGKV